MATIRRWNYDKQAYEPYEISDEWTVRSYSNDMDEIVNCPHCGRKVTFGECYTSKEIHTECGFGYAVCEECYDMERTREKEWRKREQAEAERHSI